MRQPVANSRDERTSAWLYASIAALLVVGVLGAVIKGRQYYRDTRGYCYYVDQYGNPIYDYNTRC